MTRSHKDRAHAALGASSAHRWSNCPGSVAMCEGVQGEGTSTYAEEGTAAHELGERCLKQQVDAMTFLDATFNKWTVTEEMADAVQVFLDYCNAAKTGSKVMLLEKRFDLASLHPPAPMYGTADVIIYDDDELEVVDYKHGRGVAVDAVGNLQLRYYALGAALATGWTGDRIKLTIVQPRAGHTAGIIRSDTMTWDELLDYSADIMKAARATMEPDAPLVAGDWCRWCSAKGQCPALRAKAMEVAVTEFDDLGPMPDARLIPIGEVARMMQEADALEAWIKGLRTFVYEQLTSGASVPGFKLVAKRATRKIVSEKELVNWFREEGLDPADAFVHKAKSPAQIEKTIVAQGYKKNDLPAELVESVSSGNNVARSDDPRPAAIVGSEFPEVGD